MEGGGTWEQSGGTCGGSDIGLLLWAFIPEEPSFSPMSVTSPDCITGQISKHERVTTFCRENQLEIGQMRVT